MQTPFIWHELVTSNQDKSGKFFTELFGWTKTEVNAGKFWTYTLFQIDGQNVAGMMNHTPETPSKESFWHSYINVDDVDLCAEKALAQGGKVIVSPHDVPDVGRICIVEDPTGATAHLMQPLKS